MYKWVGEKKLTNPTLEEVLELGPIDVHKALSLLPIREHTILWKRYVEHKTLREIGREHGVRAERIRLIEGKSLRRLRHPTLYNQFTKGGIMGNAKGHKLSEYIKLNDKKKDKRLKKYRNKVVFSMRSPDQLEKVEPWISRTSYE